MRIKITVVDDEGKQYHGAADLTEGPGQGTPDAQLGSIADSESKQRQPKGLPGHILALRGDGFFSEPRTPNEVHEKLQRNYRCLLDRVQMALLRLQRRRELRKAMKRDGDGDKVAYVW